MASERPPAQQRRSGDQQGGARAELCEQVGVDALLMHAVRRQQHQVGLNVIRHITYIAQRGQCNAAPSQHSGIRHQQRS